MTKILAISNIHGRYDEFVQLFRNITKDYSLQAFDKIILLGDYIAYGKQNLEIMDCLLALKKKYSNLVLLKGNWEEVLYQTQRSTDEVSKREAYNFFVSYGQANILNEFKTKRELFGNWLAEINKMPAYHVEGDYLFSHAGPNLAKWHGQHVNAFLENDHHSVDFLWSVSNHMEYTHYWATRILHEEEPFPKFPYKVVFGQTAINKLYKEEETVKYTQPFQIGDAYGIDFGAMYAKGRLGAVVFDDYGMKTYVVDVKEKQKETPSINRTNQKPIQKDPKTPPKQTLSKEKPNQGKEQTLQTTLEMCQSGLSVKQIAEKRKLKESTIEQHILDLFKQKKEIDLTPFVRNEHEPAVVQAIKTHKSKGLKAIKESLPKQLSYFDIKAIGAKHRLL